MLSKSSLVVLALCGRFAGELTEMCWVEMCIGMLWKNRLI